MVFSNIYEYEVKSNDGSVVSVLHYIDEVGVFFTNFHYFKIWLRSPNVIHSGGFIRFQYIVNTWIKKTFDIEYTNFNGTLLNVAQDDKLDFNSNFYCLFLSTATVRPYLFRKFRCQKYKAIKHLSKISFILTDLHSSLWIFARIFDAND